MHRDCFKCEKTYSGSFVGALHYSSTKTKIGYFGGWCDCGGKLNDSYTWHGILDKQKKVYSKDELHWRKSLTARQHQEIFGGPPNAIMYHFSYAELFLAKSPKDARKRFLALYRAMRKDVRGKARLINAGYQDGWDDGGFCASYSFDTAGNADSLTDSLELRRIKLGVKRYH